MRQTQIAKRLNIVDSYVSGMMSGKKTPGVSTAKKAAEITGLHWGDLYDMDGPAFIEAVRAALESTDSEAA